jgi:DNA repair protein RecO (recombination protein O)
LLKEEEIISVDGIVVSSTPFKENSKIINIFTKEKGIIGCVSKGCKKLKSPLRLISESFAYGTFHLYYKEDKLSTLIDGDIKNYLINSKSDIVKISYLSYLCELSVNVYKESESEDIYSLLEAAILKIEEGYNPQIITNIIELQYLKYIGIDLNLDGCVVCGNNKVVTLSLSKGGYICSNHRTNEPIIDEKVLKLLRLYNYVDISKITNLDIDNSISNEINRLINEYYDEYSGINIKSKKFLKDLE